jgi:hypothetical protein
MNLKMEEGRRDFLMKSSKILSIAVVISLFQIHTFREEKFQ